MLVLTCWVFVSFKNTLATLLGPANRAGIWKNALRCLTCMNKQMHCFVKLITRALLLQRDRERHLSVEILQLQNISLENTIGWHYLRDSTFSRCDTISEWDRHTHRQTDRHTTMAYTALSIASRGKNRPYCTAHQL